MNAHILIVDDDRKLADTLVRHLELADYRVSVVQAGNALLDAVFRGQVDIVLLETMLRDEDGLAWCRQLRVSSDIPIIVMASAHASDCIAALGAGADDYLREPFSAGEVLARVRAALRRRPPVSTKERAGLCIDVTAHRVVANGLELDLTGAEYRLLKTLYAKPGRVFERDEILAEIQKSCRRISGRTVDVHVKNLRQKLEVCGLVNVITTVYGVGYRWQ